MQFKRLLLTITFSFNLLLAGFAQEPTLLEHGGGVRTVAFSSVDASFVASAGESNIIKLYNLQNDTVQTLRGHTGTVNSIAFSPNGELLASVSDDRTIKLWNVRNQQNIRTLQDGTHYRSVAFSPDGQLLATGGGMHVKLWDARLHVEIGTLPHDQGIRAINFSYNSQLLATGDDSGTVKVWDVKSRQAVVSLNANPKNVKVVEFSSDNRYLASSGWNGYLKVWDTSNWELQYTIPNVGHYDIGFSPDAKVVASTGNGYVGLWWVEDGTKVAQLPGPTDWMHPVDFSHDGTFLAVGAEDGMVRIWRIDTSFEVQNTEALRILHIDTYFQELSRINAATAENIPEPAPPPAIVRDFFDLDPFYEQWINVGGLPVIASAQVNPYALKEAAWLIEKMIGHRPEVLRAMVGNQTRFSVIAHTEIITEIPEYRNNAPPDFLIYRERGWGGSGIVQVTVSSSEEDILNYQGSRTRGRYNVLIHEVAHGIHRFGFNTVDPTFDERLRDTYEAAMKKGLWNGTYASSDRKEYWAEGTQAWFHPNGGGSFDRFGDTRQALKLYDPRLAQLLAEVYGDGRWRYTLPQTRTHLPHLQGFNRQEAPIFKGWPELETLYRELSNPNSTGGGKWVNLKHYAPNQLSHLRGSNVRGDRTTMIFVNSTNADVLIYSVSSNATESFWTRIYPGRVRWTGSGVNKIWLVKDVKGKKIAIFQTQNQTGRALIGASTSGTNRTAQRDIRNNVSQPQVLIAQSERPPMYWIDTGTLHRLTSAKVENLVPSVRNAVSLAVDMTDEKLYWAEKTGNRTGKIRRADLDGSNPQLVKDLTAAPLYITLDTTNGKLYLINGWNKIQRMNRDGTAFQPNLVTGLQAPKGLAVDAAGNKMYWIEQTGKSAGKISRANLDGSAVEVVKTLTSVPGGIALDTTGGKVYITNAYGKVQQMNLDGSNYRSNLITGLKSPMDLAVDAVGGKVYWRERDSLRRADLNGENVVDVVTGVGTSASLVLGTMPMDASAPVAPTVTVASGTGKTVLLANYPNPFNPETWIPYQLAVSADVRVSIYAVDGRLVRRLDLGHQPVGNYKSRRRAAYWDGRNEVGEPVVSGVYFYTLTVGNFTATRKMLIRK